jgi:hypothetical protein
VGDDPAGDQLLLSLARASVGHVAVLRDPARPTPVVGPPEPGEEDPFPDASSGAAGADGAAPTDGPRLEPEDVALGLSYLTEFDVLVVTDTVPPGILPVAVEAASFAGARLVALVGPGPVGIELPGDALVLEAPGPDSGAFGALVGRLAAGMDRGLDPQDALREATGAAGWEAVADDA